MWPNMLHNIYKMMCHELMGAPKKKLPIAVTNHFNEEEEKNEDSRKSERCNKSF